MRNRARRALRGLFRRTAYAALISKLLVPVGYMPNALADGGPITLCDAGLPPAFVVGRSAHETDHAGETEVIADGAPAALADGSRHADEPSHGASHDHEDEADHGPWERCSLGGLASLAALAAHEPETHPSHTADERPALEDESLHERPVIVVRSRGPPSISL